MSDEEEHREGFPGLDKRHGFFKAIERNQVSRDDYHKKQEVWIEEKKKELDVEKTSSEEQDGDGFPGLNKKHGFFKVIEKNQVSRDDYHKKQEVWREEKKKELDAEISEKKITKRKNREGRRRPDRAVYQPPGMRSGRVATVKQQPRPHCPPAPPILYCIEIEVKPGLIWTKEVDRYGVEHSLARDAAVQYDLGRDVEDTLREIIQEYEAQLKLKNV